MSNPITNEPGKARIAFLGLGAMGARMAHNIRKAGYDLSVYNRDASKAAPFQEQGCRVAASPEEAVRNADFVITMLANDQAVAEVMLGQHGNKVSKQEQNPGTLSAIQPGAIYINMSTTSPELSERLEAAGQLRNVAVLSVPVAGSIKPAEEGKLVLLAGGDQKAFELAKPVLQTMGQTIHYFDSGKKALMMKLLVNQSIIVQISTLAESLALGRQAGIEQTQLLEIMGSGATASDWLKLKIAAIQKADYSPTFDLALGFKDIGLVTEQYHKYQVPGMLAAAAEHLFTLALHQDPAHGENDLSAVVPLLGPVKRTGS